MENNTIEQLLKAKDCIHFIEIDKFATSIEFTHYLLNTYKEQNINNKRQMLLLTLHFFKNTKYEKSIIKFAEYNLDLKIFWRKKRYHFIKIDNQKSIPYKSFCEFTKADATIKAHSETTQQVKIDEDEDDRSPDDALCEFRRARGCFGTGKRR